MIYFLLKSKHNILGCLKEAAWRLKLKAHGLLCSLRLVATQVETGGTAGKLPFTCTVHGVSFISQMIQVHTGTRWAGYRSNFKSFDEKNGLVPVKPALLPWNSYPGNWTWHRKSLKGRIGLKAFLCHHLRGDEERPTLWPAYSVLMQRVLVVKKAVGNVLPPLGSVLSSHKKLYLVRFLPFWTILAWVKAFNTLESWSLSQQAVHIASEDAFYQVWRGTLCSPINLFKELARASFEYSNLLFLHQTLISLGSTGEINTKSLRLHGKISLARSKFWQKKERMLHSKNDDARVESREASIVQKRQPLCVCQ